MKVSIASNRPILSPCLLENFNYQVEAYVGCEHYCYYCYVLDQAETDWSKEILIHKDISGQLHGEIEKISPQTIYMGYYTDPYQPREAAYRQTRKALELLSAKGFSASILTKSDLVVRDMDLLRDMDSAAVSMSIAFNDNQTRRKFEANTIDTEARIDALGELRAAGVRTGALICPVIPYITDVAPLIDMLVPCTDAIWIYGISIEKRSHPNWRNMQNILARHFPDLKAKIESAIFSKDHPYWAGLRKDLLQIKEDKQLPLNIQI
jgi:DNA repair photolyase